MTSDRSRITFEEISNLLENTCGILDNSNCIMKLLVQSEEEYTLLLACSDSADTIREYICNISSDIVYYERTRKNDGELYKHTKGDGLCSLRAALIATQYHHLQTNKLPMDLDITDADLRQWFLQLIESRMKEFELHEFVPFLKAVINYLKYYDFGSRPPSSQIWPDARLLQFWIGKYIPWCHYMTGIKWTNIMYDRVIGVYNIGEDSMMTFSFQHIKEFTTTAKSIIKFRHSHFYAIPRSTVAMNDINEAISDLSVKIANLLGVKTDFRDQFPDVGIIIRENVAESS